MDGTLAKEGDQCFQPLAWDVTDSYFHILWNLLHKTAALLVLDVKCLLIYLLYRYAAPECSSLYTLFQGFFGSSVIKIMPAMHETWVRFLGLKDHLEEKNVTCSIFLAWEIPRTEECDWLQSRGLQESDTT